MLASLALVNVISRVRLKLFCIKRVPLYAVNSAAVAFGTQSVGRLLWNQVSLVTDVQVKWKVMLDEFVISFYFTSIVFFVKCFDIL